jgi:AraC-like DNA-binding protein
MEGAQRPHHRHCTFQYTLSGSGRFRDGETTREVPEGTGFLNEAADPETAYWYPEEAAEPWVVLWIMLGNVNGMVREIISQKGHMYSVPRDTSILQEFCSFRGSEHRVVDMSFNRAGMLALNLLDTLVESKLSSSREGAQHLLVRKAMLAVRENLDFGIDVSALAAMLEVSREHLARVFKEHVGRPPSRFIQEEKMHYACELLRDTSMLCREIADRLGYNSSSNFIRAFRNVTGVIPAHFREEGRMLTEPFPPA